MSRNRPRFQITVRPLVRSPRPRVRRLDHCYEAEESEVQTLLSEHTRAQRQQTAGLMTSGAVSSGKHRSTERQVYAVWCSRLYAEYTDGEEQPVRLKVFGCGTGRTT